MEKEDLIQRALSITNVSLQREELYSLLQELNLPFKKTRCIKCLQDYKLMIFEELGLIESASELSSFNYEYKYLKSRSVLWNRDGKMVKINQKTPIDIIEEFIKTHKGFYKKIDK